VLCSQRDNALNVFACAATSTKQAFAVVDGEDDAVRLEFRRNGFGLSEQSVDLLLGELIVS
jgi:predicted HAD superfamily phosphohydrolase